MSLRVIFIIIITALLTIFFMQNSEPVTVKLFFDSMTISKLALLPGLALFGFLFGYLMGRSGKRKASRLQEEAFDRIQHENSNKKWYSTSSKPLSAEDEEYLKDS